MNLRVLMPAVPQAEWKLPAVANFFLGGLGAGLYLVAVIAAGFRASPALSLAAWLGPALVAAGFGAVATEAGRPLRGIRVLRQVRTSWMSRELWLGGAFIALAGAELVAPAPALRVLAAGAAVAFVLAQGFILRCARGVAAWDVAVMPAVFLASAMLSGAGLYLFVEVLADRTPGLVTLSLLLPVLPVGLIVWLGYVGWTHDAAFAAAVAPLRSGLTAAAVVGLGYVLPFLGGTLSAALPAHAPALGFVTAVLMVVGQARAKWALLREVGTLRPITLPRPTGVRAPRRVS